MIAGVRGWPMRKGRGGGGGGGGGGRGTIAHEAGKLVKLVSGVRTVETSLAYASDYALESN